MNIKAFNDLEQSEKQALLTQCCGSSAWVDKMMKLTWADRLDDLFANAEKTWFECHEDDWKEAFLHHPKIGDINALRYKFSLDRFAGSEQSAVDQASEKFLQLLASLNKEYEEKFGYIFIVCATGKSAEEMLDLLTERLQNPAEEEIQIAMKEQNKITKLRLEKLFKQ
jgi:2-oxo-4-hydroxy-4-carboxy-5-ureidoimidazoline decarboxylase